MKIVTHDSTFHADDVFAVATLLLKFPDAEVVRSRDQAVIQSADIVVDVGAVYDPATLRFDHHQEGGVGIRENGIPYASFGLVWKEYGESVAGVEEAKYIEEKLVLAIDARDNGVDISRPVFENITDYTIAEFLNSYVDRSQKDSEYFYKVFMEVVGVAKALVEREVANSKIYLESVARMKKYAEEAIDKRLIVLEEYLPWKKVLVPIAESLYVVYPRIDGKWGVEAVYAALQGFDRKKLFPEAWAGKRDEELASVTGVPEALFCHNHRFIVVAKTKEAALKLAKLAINA